MEVGRCCQVDGRDKAHATSFQFCKNFFFFGGDDVSIEESKDIADGICVFLSGILPTVQRAANAYGGHLRTILCLRHLQLDWSSGDITNPWLVLLVLGRGQVGSAWVGNQV